jgi:hypothetical protein
MDEQCRPVAQLAPPPGDLVERGASRLLGVQSLLLASGSPRKLTASPRNPTASARVAAPMSGRSRPLSVAARVRSGSWRGASGDIPAVSGDGGGRRWTEGLTLQQRDGHAPDLERLGQHRRRGTAFQPPLDRVQLLLCAVVLEVLVLEGCTREASLPCGPGRTPRSRCGTLRRAGAWTAQRGP